MIIEKVGAIIYLILTVGLITGVVGFIASLLVHYG